MSKKPEMAQINLRPMTLSDLEEVAEIDRVSFSMPWPKEAFLYELRRTRKTLCWVAEWVSPGENPILLASIVIWFMGDKAHIGTLAVIPGYRRRGTGQQLLAKALLECIRCGIQQVTLEVRQSNQGAQQLYQKFGFKEIGLREDYYKDTHEDAVMMALTNLDEKKLAILANCG